MKDKVKKYFKQSIVYLKHFINNLSFQAKLIICIIFTISVYITVCAFLIIQNIQSSIDRQIITLNNNLQATKLLSQFSEHIIDKHYNSPYTCRKKLNELTTSFMEKHKEIAYAIFTDHSGYILCKTKFAHSYPVLKNNSSRILPPKNFPFIKISYSETGKVLNIAEPIQKDSKLLGWLWIGIPDTGFTIVGSKKELVIFLFEIFLLVWLILTVGAIVNSLIITRPIRKLEKGAKVITEGRFGFQLPLKGFLGKELTHLVKAFNKMSKRLQQYEESNLAILSSERNKFESVVMSIADGVIVFDRNFNIQIVNPAACYLLTMSQDELLRQKITNILNAKINEQINNYFKNEKASSNNSEYAIFHLIRENKNLKLLATPLFDSNNEIAGGVITIHDRTKEAEIEHLKQEFISNVSHELRTPITSIKCYVDTLYTHNERINEKTKSDFLEIVNEEVDRLSNLVNDVLELSRLESPNTKLVLTYQEVQGAIDYALKSTSVLAHKKSIKLIKDVDNNLPPIYINQENIERILVNLLSNAIKYTPGNGTVKLIVKRNIKTIDFQIIDNGIGIQEEHIPLIFDRFYRVENKVHTIKGTGLGLTIVKKSVEQHGGTLSVKSKLGEGSIFEFSLPISEEVDTSKVKDFEKESQMLKTA